MTFRGGDAASVGYTETQRRGKRQALLVEGLQRRRGEREEIFLGCLGELLPSLQVQKKKKGVGVSPKDLHQMSRCLPE